MSADLRGADRAHRKSSGVLAELLRLWEVVNVVDENLTPGEGGLRRPSVVDGKGNLARAYGPGEPLLVELPGIESLADQAICWPTMPQEPGRVTAAADFWRFAR